MSDDESDSSSSESESSLQSNGRESSSGSETSSFKSLPENVEQSTITKTSPTSSSSDNFRNDLTINSGLDPIKKCPTLITAEELIKSDLEVWTVQLPSTVLHLPLTHFAIKVFFSSNFVQILFLA